MELAGIGCLIAFAWFIWPPAALLVLGVALIVIGMSFDGVEMHLGRRDESESDSPRHR